MTKENQFGLDGAGAVSTGSGQTLRQRAEEIAREKAFRIPKNMESLSIEAARQMLHELRVYQIELEMQNKELRRTQGELEASRAQYFDLYDLAPVGYCTLGESALILEANLTAANMLGVERSALVKQPLPRFILPEDQDIYYGHRKRLFETGAPQVCEIRIVRADAAPLWVRIDATAAQDVDGAPVCRTVIIDIAERKQAEEQLQKSLEQLRRSAETIIKVLVMAAGVKDPHTAGHQHRVTNLVRAIATEMVLPPEKIESLSMAGIIHDMEMVLSPEKIESLSMAGVIHDIGKITLPTETLSKPTKLSALDLYLIREHVRLGYDILKDVESPWPLAEIIYQHHERMDGSGYPRGLKGEEILIEARILAVADAVETMSSNRSYRPALGIDAALAEIEKNKGTLYDPAAVEICLRLFREKGFQLERWISSAGADSLHY